MWTAVTIEEVPPTLQRFGLGREPVWSDADRVWYAKSGDQWMRHPGMGACGSYSTTCVGCGRVHTLPDEEVRRIANRHLLHRGINPRVLQHHGVGAEGLGDLSNSPALDAAASALGDALQTNGATTSTMGGVCSAFQSAYNAAGGSPQIQVDDYYGPCTQAALQAYYNAAVSGGSGPAQQAPASAFGGTCNNGTYTAPAGGGGGGGGGSAVTPAGGSTTTNPYTKPILIGAGVVAAGLVGYALWKNKHHMKRIYRVVSPSHRLR